MLCGALLSFLHLSEGLPGPPSPWPQKILGLREGYVPYADSCSIHRPREAHRKEKTIKALHTSSD